MDLITTQETLRDAARWHARLHAADCTQQDRIAFEQWRRCDAAHARAYELAERTSRQVSELTLGDPRLRELARWARQTPVEDDADDTSDAIADLPHVTEMSVPGCAARKPRHHWKIPAALAASVAIAICLVRFVPDAMRSETPVLAFESPANSMRTVTLADGSSVQLDVASRILVDLRDDRRLVTLVSGRAVFDVAHDRSRPFSVTAADSRTTALGTRFQVQLDSTDVVVTLAQGSVAIDNEGRDDSSATQSWHEQLQPGEQLRVDTVTDERIRATVDTGAITSWTRGRHLFRSTPLHEAIDEVNRYAQKKVRLGDPSLADLQVGGNFIAGDSELIVAAFAAVLPLSVVDGTNEIILFRRHESPL
jgi:transmembrane sensor